MKDQILKSFIFCVAVLCGITAIGQSKFEQAPDEHGKLTTGKNAGQFINSFKVLTNAKAKSLENTVNTIRDAIAKLPKANAPIGYDTRIFFSTSAFSLKGDRPTMSVNCYLRTLHKDMKTGVISASMDGADLYVKINDFDLFTQMGNYWQDCDKLKMPVFFEEIPLTKATEDYIEFQYKGDPLRIVTAGSKPLFVPLTRKEFLEFLIARKNFQIKDDQNIIEDLYKTIKESSETLAHPSPYLTDESVKKALADGITTQEKQVAQFKEEIKNKQAQIEQYRVFLQNMKPQDAAAPARLNYNIKTDELMGGIEQLVPAGRKEGILLTKINPGYFNHSFGAPTAQMIVLYYAWPKVGFAQDPNFVEQAAVDIFNGLDYHQLKESMK